MNSTLRKNNVCAVIPFYNEERTIKDIIEKTLNYVDLIICIDDGSIDDSLKRIPETERIVVLKNNVNRGKGFSLKRGFEKSIKLNTNYTITLDADLQHSPEHIPHFIEKLKLNDLVIGNRLNNLTECLFKEFLVIK